MSATSRTELYPSRPSHGLRMLRPIGHKRQHGRARNTSGRRVEGQLVQDPTTLLWHEVARADAAESTKVGEQPRAARRYGPKRTLLGWLKVQCNRPDGVGDLSREVIADLQAPARGGPRTMTAYLAGKTRTLAALKRAVAEWRAQLPHHAEQR